MEADHTCFTRACVNPAHLRWLTVRENRLARRHSVLTAEERRLRHNAYYRAYRAKLRAGRKPKPVIDDPPSRLPVPEHGTGLGAEMTAQGQKEPPLDAGSGAADEGGVA